MHYCDKTKMMALSSYPALAAHGPDNFPQDLVLLQSKVTIIFVHSSSDHNAIVARYIKVTS